ncbi:MAG: hypothetical protein LBE84_04945 [Planctomycetota bacterium]|jgi:hypothetical protein|nr:hypothetical protein [Planctomycetota bacterium]
MINEEKLADLLTWTAAQATAYEKRARSRVEKQYGDTMKRSAATLTDFVCTASFGDLLIAEKAFQRNDLIVYAQLPSTLKSVEQGIADFNAGEKVYRQLLETPEAYKEHAYRDSEKAAPDKLVPLDAMRRALRGQAKRVENYRKNVMGNPQEHEFLSERVAMLRRGEKLYDAIQRERFLIDEKQ